MIGWIVPRVGVGLARIGMEAAAVRRREVVVLGFGFPGIGVSFKEEVDFPRISVREIVEKRDDGRYLKKKYIYM